MLLLECIKVYAATFRSEGLDWEGIRANYDKFREFFVERCRKAEIGTNSAVANYKNTGTSTTIYSS